MEDVVWDRMVRRRNYLGTPENTQNETKAKGRVAPVSDNMSYNTTCGFDRANGLVSGLRYPYHLPSGSF